MSVTYYAMASTITKRILRLARFMRTLNNDNLRQHIIKHDKLDEKDEIGFLKRESVDDPLAEAMTTAAGIISDRDYVVEAPSGELATNPSVS